MSCSPTFRGQCPLFLGNVQCPAFGATGPYFWCGVVDNKGSVCQVQQRAIAPKFPAKAHCHQSDEWLSVIRGLLRIISQTDSIAFNNCMNVENKQFMENLSFLKLFTFFPWIFAWNFIHYDLTWGNVWQSTWGKWWLTLWASLLRWKWSISEYNLRLGTPRRYPKTIK